MSIFEDISQFLENQLDEFLKNNPHLELQALEEQLKEQERDTLKVLLDLKKQEQSLQDQILAIATQIQTWHTRVSKAQKSGREDLAKAAQAREAELMREGNQVWGKMEGIKITTAKSRELLQQIQQRRQEVKEQAKANKANNPNHQSNQSASYTSGWNQSQNQSSKSDHDSLEAQFQQWELDEELKQMKRNM